MQKPEHPAVTELGLAIDAANDLGDIAALRSALLSCSDLELVVDSQFVPLVMYFRGNAHAALRRLSDPQKKRAWRDPDLEGEVFHLRRAIAHPNFEDLEELRRLQVFTNLANAFQHLGRSVEAIELFDQALAIHPKFGMALGNRGLSRSEFARSLFDNGHFSLGLLMAHTDLRATREKGVLWDSSGYKSARAGFQNHADWIEKGLDIERRRATACFDGWRLGRSHAERTYRRWALHQRLFLNPLNVLGQDGIAAADVLTLPPHRAPIGDPPQYIAWFNQMVQEFVSARVLLFDGTHVHRRHYADRAVTLVNTLDYPAFSIAVEQVRFSFRSAYSLLDKIAGFINSYFNLGIDPADVTIRRVWHDRKALRLPFEQRPNWHLRGLYWLSRDIADDHDADSEAALEPDARQLKQLRHALEHRSLVLREMDGKDGMGIVQTMPLGAFEAKTLKLLKLVRAALIHLSLAIHDEERKKTSQMPELAIPQSLPTYRGQ